MPLPPPPLAKLIALLLLTALAIPASAQTLSANANFTGLEGMRWAHELDIAGQKVTQLEVLGTTTRIRLEGGLGVRGENDETSEVAEETICLDDGAFDNEGNPVSNYACQNEYTIPAYRQPAVVWPTAAGNTFTFASGSEPDEVHWQIITKDDNCRNSADIATVRVTLMDNSFREIEYTINDDDLLPCS